ncbi:hypothetical protein, partial [Helicobacter bilis]|uniref:hypothetical protein n=1 Tax=Helicobacter bilis TaxID=37372 RepID=UPI0026EA60DF
PPPPPPLPPPPAPRPPTHYVVIRFLEYQGLILEKDKSFGTLYKHRLQNIPRKLTSKHNNHFIL